MYYIIQADWVIKYQIFVFVLIKLPVNLAIEEEITQMLFFFCLFFFYGMIEIIFTCTSRKQRRIFSREKLIWKKYMQVLF